MYPHSSFVLVRKALAILLMGSWLTIGWAQSPIALSQRQLGAVQQVVMPAQNNQLLLEEELNRRGPGIAPRFAVTMPVNITPETYGNWEQLPGGMSVWRLRLRSAGAHSINLGFTRYIMPERGSLILYSPDGKRMMGPFTPADNEEHGQLWTPIFEGDELVLEVQVPTPKRSELQLHLTSVNHDFLGFSEIVSGSCHLDVICGAADGWAIVDHYRDIIQSVAVVGVNGATFCTGFLINNARNDCTPYFITSGQCGIADNGLAPSMVAYWNYQNSFCRQPNSPQSGSEGNGQLNTFNTGAIFRAWNTSTIFTLLELDDDIPASANAFFAGWVLADDTPHDTVICIHHPVVDEKRISFEFDPTYRGNYNSGSTPVPDGNHVIVPDWDIGATEPGSFGAPLFDRHKRVVGHLTGGSADCSNNLYTSFGWFTASWLGGGAPDNQLKYWLDPDDTGITSLDGNYNLWCGIFVSADEPVQSVCAFDTAVYNIQTSNIFSNMVNLSINDLPAGLTATLNQNSVLPGGSAILTITGTESLPAGSYSFSVTGTDATFQAADTLSLIVYNSITQPVLTGPANGAASLALTPEFTWTGASTGTTFDLQVASDPDFTQLVAELTGLTASSANGIQLGAESTYYWRVRANNPCGESDWTAPFSLITAAISCVQLINNTPVAISEVGTPTVTSTINVSVPGRINHFRINGLNIQHTWVGDVFVQLTSPSGTQIVLIDRPGVPETLFGCDGENILVNLYDDAANTADDLENSCSSMPAISGDYQPANSFAEFFNEPAAGAWTLTINDAVDLYGGVMNSWQLEVCAVVPSVSVLHPAPAACSGDSTSLEMLATGFIQETIVILANGLPSGASLSYSPTPATTGESITATFHGLTVPGDYPIQLLITDGVDTVFTDMILTVNSALGQATLLSPPNNTTIAIATPQLTWSAAAGATTYTVEISRNDNFTDIVQSATVTGTSVNVNALPEPGVYYWRVSPSNGCGSSMTSTFNFNFQPSSAETLQGHRLFIEPNPTFGLLNVRFSAPLSGELQVEVFNANGQRLQKQTWLNAPVQFSIDLSSYAPAAYFVRFISHDDSTTQRIIKH
jgi:subtilisin-like proprotein convertase family protein